MFDIAEAFANMFDEVSYDDFYDDLFPVGSFEKKGIQEKGKYNGIAVSVSPKIGEEKPKVRRHLITDDHEAIDDIVWTDDFCLMSPISYAGKTRKSDNARFLYAIAIDLDGVESLKNLHVLIKQFENAEHFVENDIYWGLPSPTYLISSGTGIHLYYVFEKPIPLFRNIVKQLEVLKRRLTWQAWTQGASELHDDIQYESLFQGFRMVGSITKNGGRCRAFKYGDKVDLEYLNRHVPEKYRMTEFTYKSDLLLAEAEKKYPEWYQRRIVEKRPCKTWVCKKDLYDWWLRQIYDGAEEGHRYWCIMTLATYAKKCQVPEETLEKDALGLVSFLNTRGTTPFTNDDVLKALEAFDDSYITYPIHTIEHRTGIQIPRNKRNYRTQEMHIKFMNNQRRFKVEIGECTNGGRKPKSDVVREWRAEHPNGKKSECIRETGLSKPTVLKWWDSYN